MNFELKKLKGPDVISYSGLGKLLDTFIIEFLTCW